MPATVTDLTPLTARLPAYTANARRYARAWLGGDRPARTAAAAETLARFNRAQAQPWSEARAQVYDAVARQQRRRAAGA